MKTKNRQTIAPPQWELLDSYQVPTGKASALVRVMENRHAIGYPIANGHLIAVTVSGSRSLAREIVAVLNSSGVKP